MEDLLAEVARLQARGQSGHRADTGRTQSGHRADTGQIHSSGYAADVERMQSERRAARERPESGGAGRGRRRGTSVPLPFEPGKSKGWSVGGPRGSVTAISNWTPRFPGCPDGVMRIFPAHIPWAFFFRLRRSLPAPPPPAARAHCGLHLHRLPARHRVLRRRRRPGPPPSVRPLAALCPRPASALCPALCPPSPCPVSALPPPCPLYLSIYRSIST